MTSKHLTIYLIVGFLFFAAGVFIGEARAGEVDVQVLQHTRLADDDMYQTGSWTGIQINYGGDTNYLFGSYEETAPIPLWGIGGMNLLGFGAGSKWKINDRLTLFGQLGYYIVDQEFEGRGAMDGGEPTEGMNYYFNTRYNDITNKDYIRFDEYMINYDNTIAGTIGLNFTQPVTENLNFGFTIAYRSMKIRELFRVMKDEWNFDETGVCWEQQNTRNYSSISYGVTLNYQF